MSKASEWAKDWQAVNAKWPMRFRDPREGTDRPGPYVQLAVDEAGECRVMKNNEWVATLRPDDALKLARWILDTFGEATGPSRAEGGDEQRG